MSSSSSVTSGTPSVPAVVQPAREEAIISRANVAAWAFMGGLRFIIGLELDAGIDARGEFEA